jgi:hypothetical protein
VRVDLSEKEALLLLLLLEKEEEPPDSLIFQLLPALAPFRSAREAAKFRLP